MLFGKRKKTTERVLDLKARVDALRPARDSAAQPRSFDHFLAGDDVITGREAEDHDDPSHFLPDQPPSEPEPTMSDYEAALAAELEKYLQREEERARRQQAEGVADGMEWRVSPEDADRHSDYPSPPPQRHS